MTITVTTYGKFEELRKNLVNDLLNDNNLSNKMNQKILESALFTDVVTACEAASSVYINDNMERWKSEPDNVMRETYNAYLEPFLSALSDALKIEESCLEIHVSNFIKGANEVNERLFDYLKEIGKTSTLVKSSERDKLYGPNFKNDFNILANKLLVNDIELIEQAKLAVAEKINNEFKNDSNILEHDKKLLSEHAIFILEVGSQKNPLPNFDADFKKETGKSMDEFKSEIRIKNNIRFTSEMQKKNSVENNQSNESIIETSSNFSLNH